MSSQARVFCSRNLRKLDVGFSQWKSAPRSLKTQLLIIISLFFFLLKMIPLNTPPKITPQKILRQHSNSIFFCQRMNFFVSSFHSKKNRMPKEKEIIKGKKYFKKFAMVVVFVAQCTRHARWATGQRDRNVKSTDLPHFFAFSFSSFGSIFRRTVPRLWSCGRQVCRLLPS